MFVRSWNRSSCNMEHNDNHITIETEGTQIFCKWHCILRCLASDISDDHVAFLVKCNQSMKNRQYGNLEATYWRSGNNTDSQKGAGVLKWQWKTASGNNTDSQKGAGVLKWQWKTAMLEVLCMSWWQPCNLRSDQTQQRTRQAMCEINMRCLENWVP
jgi:hypothetical protein